MKATTIDTELENQHEQSHGLDNQLPQESQLCEGVVSLNLDTVRRILSELLCQEEPSLSDSARDQRVERILPLICTEPIFPPELVGMSLSLARSWVLLSLRKNRIPLGVENEFDKLFLRLMMGLQRIYE